MVLSSRNTWIESRRIQPFSHRHKIGRAIRNLQEHLGNPRSHRGLGIRKNAANFYQLRVGLDYRLIFTNEVDYLQIVAEGSHDQITRFLKQKF